MSNEGAETFEVSPQQAKPERREKQTVADKSFLHVTIVDHNPVIEGTDEASFVDVRIPLGMVEAGLRIIPAGKLGEIDPTMIVQMVEMGAAGELLRVNEGKKSILIRIE